VEEDELSQIASMEQISVGASVYPRVQLWTIADYFQNRLPNLPPLNNPYTGKPMRAALPLSL